MSRHARRRRYRGADVRLVARIDGLRLDVVDGVFDSEGWAQITIDSPGIAHHSGRLDVLRGRYLVWSGMIGRGPTPACRVRLDAVRLDRTLRAGGRDGAA